MTGCIKTPQGASAGPHHKKPRRDDTRRNTRTVRYLHCALMSRKRLATGQPQADFHLLNMRRTILNKIELISDLLLNN
jgi:hypothetical protein